MATNSEKNSEKNLAKKEAEGNLLIHIRKDTLAREAALDQVTLNKIKDKWFETLIDTKVPQMQDNLRHILHYMERLIEAENFRKLIFEDERQELEEKTIFQAKAHESALKTLFGIYERRIQYLKDAYHEMVSEKKAEAEAEFQMINDREKNSQDNINMTIFQMQENKEKEEKNMNCDMRFKMDEELSKNTELMESMQTRLQRKMESRWGEITNILSNYEENTGERTIEYLNLKTKDDKDSKIIVQQVKKMQKLFVQLDELKYCIDECYAPKDKISTINDLREERMKFFNTFKELKLKVAKELQEDDMKMKTLTVTSNELTKDMTKVCTKGKQILTIFSICRKFETEYEKVIPVGNPIEIPKTEGLIRSRKLAKHPQKKEKHIETEGWIKDIEVMDKFWRKLSKVRLSIMALEKCIESEKKKNERLEQILVSYFNEISTTNI